MKIELTEAQWLDEPDEISFDDLAELSGLSPELLRELVEYGALAPINTQASINAEVPIDVELAQWRFSADCIVAVRTVGRLHEDFDLDANALSVALTLIERIRGLEAQLQELQTQFPRMRLKT